MPSAQGTLQARMDALAHEALRVRREAEAIRAENLRLLVAKAMALVQIYDAVRNMMSDQNAPVTAISEELADIREAQAINANKGFTKQDKGALWSSSPSGMDRYSSD